MRAWSASGTAPARYSATSFPVPCCGHMKGDTMSMAEPVCVSVDGQVLVASLARRKANAVDVAPSRALYEAFDRLRRDPRLRAGILTGAGDRFCCAGWDLKAAAAGEAIEADHGPGGFAGITEFFDIGKPVIAAINGLALGGGFELALAADLVVAADHAEFALTEVTLGLVADAGGPAAAAPPPPPPPPPPVPLRGARPRRPRGGEHTPTSPPPPNLDRRVILR